VYVQKTVTKRSTHDRVRRHQHHARGAIEDVEDVEAPLEERDAEDIEARNAEDAEILFGEQDNEDTVEFLDESDVEVEDLTELFEARGAQEFLDGLYTQNITGDTSSEPRVEKGTFETEIETAHD
jgi:hypothetical protein